MKRTFGVFSLVMLLFSTFAPSFTYATGDENVYTNMLKDIISQTEQEMGLNQIIQDILPQNNYVVNSISNGWNCPNNQNICYSGNNVAFWNGESTDLDGDHFSAGRIKLGGYTILDRNIGATSDDISSTASYGKYYFNGSNTGYDLPDSSFSLEGDFPWDENRNQGPCPDGYHIPDVEEWANLREIWCLANGKNEKCNESELFLADLKLPKAGDAIYEGYAIYWASTKSGKNRYSYISTDTNKIEITDTNTFYSNKSLSIRCVENENEKVTIKFKESKGGDQIKQIEHVKGLGINDYPNISNDGLIIEGWYDEEGNKITRDTPIYENKTLYPKWTGFILSNIVIGGYKLMDRNLGALTSDISDTNSYGNYYYWGDNGGFPYNSSKEYVESESSWNGLEYQQGPCPNGYHIPTADEWFSIRNVWCLSKGYQIGCNNYVEFINDLKLPLAGYYNSGFYEGREKGYFWSSSNTLGLQIDPSKISDKMLAYYSSLKYYASPLRCLNNSIEYVNVRFNSNGGTVVNPKKVVKGSYIGSFPTIEKEGYALKGWYDKNGNEIKFNTPLYEDIDLYAGYTRIYNFTNSQGISFKAGTISIGNYTILDRNVGATSNNVSDPNSFGYYYYWGDNEGMLTGNLRPYVDKGTSWSNNNQGPCPNGYHVPTSGDWYNIKESLCISKGKGTNCFISEQEFVTDLKLPTAGFICNLSTCGYGGAFRYLSSTLDPHNSSNAYSIDPNGVGPTLKSSNPKNFGTPIRCVKEGSDNITVTMNPNDGSAVKELVVKKGENIPTLGSESKAEYLLGGWFYEEDGNKIELTNEDPIVNNLSLSAEWENLEEYVVNHDKNSASLDDTNVTIGDNVDVNLKKSVVLGLEDEDNVKFDQNGGVDSVIVTEGDVISSNNYEANLHGGVSVYVDKNEGGLVERIGGTAKFSRPIIVKIDLPIDSTGSVFVKVKHDGDETFGFKGLTLKEKQNCVDGEPEEGQYNGEYLEIKENEGKKYVTIYTCSASTFVAYTENEKKIDNNSNGNISNNTSSSSEGGRSAINVKSNTNIREHEHNAADTEKQEVRTNTNTKTEVTSTIKEKVERTKEKVLSRGEIAVMTNILLEVYPKLTENKSLNEVSEACEKYADEQDFTKDEKKAITRLCKLSIMGIHNDKNEPLDEFLVKQKATNGEFATVMDRVVSSYNEKDLSTIKEALKKLENDDEGVVFGTVYNIFMSIKNIIN